MRICHFAPWFHRIIESAFLRTQQFRLRSCLELVTELTLRQYAFGTALLSSERALCCDIEFIVALSTTKFVLMPRDQATNKACTGHSWNLAIGLHSQMIQRALYFKAYLHRSYICSPVLAPPYIVLLVFRGCGTTRQPQPACKVAMIFTSFYQSNVTKL